MKELLTVQRKTAAAIGHHTPALGVANRAAQIGLAGQAELALPAFGRVKRNDVITRLEAGDAFSHFNDDPRAFMSHDGWEQPFRICARQRVCVGMTDAGRLDFNQTFTLARSFELHLFNLQRLARSDGHSRTHFHTHCLGSSGKAFEANVSSRDCKHGKVHSL